jgi:hypothetical protein
MKRCSLPRHAARSALAVALVALAAAPVVASAQSRDYLLGRPDGSLSLRGGFAFATANSDIYDEVIDLFTLSRGDFSGFSGAVDLAFSATDRFDIVASGGLAQASESSEYRDWVGEDDLPIRQQTKLTRVPLTLSVKAYLTPRGREVGTLAWVPERIAPFIGAGGGAMWYRFEQEGEFIFFETSDIFQDELRSDGWTPTLHALGGVDIALGPRFVLEGEARYVYASTDLDLDFQGYGPIDLSGFQTTVGVKVRF